MTRQPELTTISKFMSLVLRHQPQRIGLALDAAGWADIAELPARFIEVTNEAYAIEIARDWNVPNSGVGRVTRFDVQAAFMARCETHQVGAAHHAEWWIPAQELEALNDHVVGLIEVTRTFDGGAQ
jgi:hypothetical protein